MYAIIRMEKRKGAAISAIEKHNNRAIEILEDGTLKQWAENANPEFKDDNVSYKRYEDLKLIDSINKRLTEVGITKTRKDAVKAVEILCTASPEFFDVNNKQNPKEFFMKATEFIRDRFGKENIMSVDIHLDEKTPHVHIVFVPLTQDNKLSAKIVCGNRKDYQKLQDDFHEKMKNLGLNRGVRGSIAKHIEMKEFYGLTKTDIAPINDFLEKRKNDSTNRYKVIADAALNFLAKHNLTIDTNTKKVRKLGEQEIEKLKKNITRNKGMKF